MFHNEVGRAEQICRSPVPLKCSFPGSYNVILPYSGSDYDGAWPGYLHKLLKMVVDADLESTNSGALLLRRNGAWEQYFFLGIQGDPGGRIDENCLLYIPEGEWLCRQSGSDTLHNVWNWLTPYASQDEIELVVETELVTADYNYIDPHLEQRCLLKKHL